MKARVKTLNVEFNQQWEKIHGGKRLSLTKNNDVAVNVSGIHILSGMIYGKLLREFKRQKIEEVELQPNSDGLYIIGKGDSFEFQYKMNGVKL